LSSEARSWGQACSGEFKFAVLSSKETRLESRLAGKTAGPTLVMSSKLIRSDNPAGAAPIGWRAAGCSAIPKAAEHHAAVDTEREMEARIRAAYQEGHAEGAAAAAQSAAQEQLEPVLAGLSGMIQDLAGTRQRFRSEAEADTVKLAIAIARRVLHRELATDPEAILGLVIAAFQKLSARETHRLRVSPSDAAIVDENRDRLEFPKNLEVSPDPSLSPGSAIFETSRGEVDASVETQLAEIERGFADIMKRRLR